MVILPGNPEREYNGMVNRVPVACRDRSMRGPAKNPKYDKRYPARAVTAFPENPS